MLHSHPLSSGGQQHPVPGLGLHLADGVPGGRGGLAQLRLPALTPPRQRQAHVRHLRRQSQRQALRCLLLRGMQGNRQIFFISTSTFLCIVIFNIFVYLGIFQEDGSEGADLRVSREQELPDRQEAEEPVPVLQIQQVHRHRHEEGGRAGDHVTTVLVSDWSIL